MSDLPVVTADWLRVLADLVERGEVDVIICEPNTGGVLLGVVKPRSQRVRQRDAAQD